MNIALTKYPISELGPGKRFGIWTAGCHKHCKNCMSGYAQKFDQKLDRTIKSITDEIKLTLKSQTIDGITISGGEPFDQDDLEELVLEIRKLGIDDILVYSGYTLDELKPYQNIFKNIAVLIDGPYVDELNDDLPLRGSSNQNIYLINPNYQKRYQEYLKQPRSFSYEICDDTITIIGVLPKGGYQLMKDLLNNK